MHVHVLTAGTPEGVELVAFRDRLREDPEIRQAYEVRTRACWRPEISDSVAYSEATAPLFRDLRPGESDNRNGRLKFAPACRNRGSPAVISLDAIAVGAGLRAQRRITMRYVMLVYETPADVDGRDDPAGEPYLAAWRAYYQSLVEADVYVGVAPLKPAATATTVRLREGRRHVQDGPFAEAKEELGGFVMLDVPSLDAALEWAARCPAAAGGALEVRPLDVDFQEAVVRP
jgi:hypothetical protein